MLSVQNNNTEGLAERSILIFVCEKKKRKTAVSKNEGLCWGTLGLIVSWSETAAVRKISKKKKWNPKNSQKDIGEKNSSDILLCFIYHIRIAFTRVNHGQVQNKT